MTDNKAYNDEKDGMADHSHQVGLVVKNCYQVKMPFVILGNIATHCQKSESQVNSHRSGMCRQNHPDVKVRLTLTAKSVQHCLTFMPM